MVNGMKGFEDLDVWQEAQLLAVEIYNETKSLPKDELYGITSQIRRAVSSVSANIAEGYGRSTPNDRLHFCSIAYGSLLETKNFLYLAQKLHYLDTDILTNLLEHVVLCQKLLNGYKKFIVASHAK